MFVAFPLPISLSGSPAALCRSKTVDRHFRNTCVGGKMLKEVGYGHASSCSVKQLIKRGFPDHLVKILLLCPPCIEDPILQCLHEAMTLNKGTSTF